MNCNEDCDCYDCSPIFCSTCGGLDEGTSTHICWEGWFPEEEIADPYDGPAVYMEAMAKLVLDLCEKIENKSIDWESMKDSQKVALAMEMAGKERGFVAVHVVCAVNAAIEQDEKTFCEKMAIGAATLYEFSGFADNKPGEE